MALRERVSQALKDAMKARDAARVSAIRMLVSAMKNKEIDLRRELDDEGVIEVLSTAAKQRRESIEQFDKGGRADLVAKESAELAVITEFLPKQMDAAEVEALVAEAVAATGASGPKDMGKVMKELMPKVKGRADGKLVGELVKKALGG